MCTLYACPLDIISMGKLAQASRLRGHHRSIYRRFFVFNPYHPILYMDNLCMTYHLAMTNIAMENHLFPDLPGEGC